MGGGGWRWVRWRDQCESEWQRGVGSCDREDFAGSPGRDAVVERARGAQPLGVRERKEDRFRHLEAQSWGKSPGVTVSNIVLMNVLSYTFSALPNVDSCTLPGSLSASAPLATPGSESIAHMELRYTI